MNSQGGCLNRSFTLGQMLTCLGLSLPLLLLGAHFYRAGEYGMALSAVGMLIFLYLRSGWKQYAVAFFLLWGVLEWGDSARSLAQMRLAMGMPWMRAAAILGAVALVTGFAGICAYNRAVRVAEEESSARFQGLVFISAFLCLFYLRQGSPLSFLLLERYLPLVGSVQIFFAAWYAAFVAGVLIDPRRSRKKRRFLWLLFGGVFFAQFLLGLLGVQGMLLTGKLHVPIPAFILFAPVFRESLSMMPIIVLAATLLAGSAWCSMLCYFGPFDGLAAGARPVAPPSPALQKALRYGRWLVLIVGLAGAAGMSAAGVSTATAVLVAVIYGLASMALMAFFSRKSRAMVHCVTACPMGLVVNLLGRVSPWRLRVDVGKCDNCGACEKVCRYYAIDEQSRAGGGTLLRCSLCRDCMGVCARGAISLRCPGLSPQLSLRVFTGVVSVLHAVFLSVAMV